MKQITLSIPNPCGMKDEDMTPIAGGHYCPKCEHEVVDSTKMSDQELISHIQKNGFGCRKLREDQLERTITVPSKKSWWGWAAALVLFTTPAYSQEKKISDTVRVDTVKKELNGDEIWKGRATGEYFIDKPEIREGAYRGTGSYIVYEKQNIFKRVWNWLFK